MIVDLGRWPDADQILDAALELPPAERMVYVRRTATDPELVAALEAVLAEANIADGFLEPAGAWSGPLAHELLNQIGDETPALAPGTFVEHYQVVAAIGRGGMGEVYRARDTRLARDVALKVLPARYARDRERRDRFQREARLLATLNHPGIAAIYGVAESNDIEALVLELVEGPTLGERIQSGPLPLPEVVSIASQLVKAIGAAHAAGILHRDLKPANIKITPSGTVKILDFGLARMLHGESVPGHVDLTQQSAAAVLGTAAYMSPEQARGQKVDERTDIWAFGCVLFEMLTGSRAFGGASAADVLAAVIAREPAFSLLPPGTPEPLRRLLRRCLDKNPDRRLGFIGDARLELEDALAPQPVAGGYPADGDLAQTDRTPRRLGTAAALAAAVIVGAAASAWYLSRPDETSLPVSRLTIALPAGDRPVTAFQPTMAISPDGRTIVYRARRGDNMQLFRRDLDGLEPVPLPGTEGASSPIFSPDGRSIAFDDDGVLKRVALDGGAPVVICNAPGGVTGAWLSDDTIVFATNTGRVLQRVRASGGTPEALTTLDSERGDTLHLLPREIPGRRALIFTIVAGASRHLATLDLDTRAVQIVTEGTHATFVDRDALVFARQGSLWGARFDTRRLTLAGTAVPLEERVAHTDNTIFHYAAVPGSLVYLPPRSSGSRQRLVWMDRQGRTTNVALAPRGYVRIALSPDNQRIALALDEDGQQDIWIAEPGRNALSRLTFEPTIETMPTWSPDGQFVAFRSEQEGPGIFMRDARGTGAIQRLTATDGPIHSPYSWTPKGETLLLAVFRSFRQQAIASVTPPDPTVRILLDGDFAQLDPQVSPDGRWLAYQSDETGRFEIYVRPYPDVDRGRWLISSAGGTSPRWNPRGGELFYHDGESIVRVAVSAGDAFRASPGTRLFDVKPFGGRLGPDFELTSDGQRFLFLIPAPADVPPPAGLVVVQNWMSNLASRLATQR